MKFTLCLGLIYSATASKVDPVIPNNCTSWFDGCNTCSVVDGAAESCTEKYCFQQGKPHCLSNAKPIAAGALEECGVWFNGCNDCKVTNGKIETCSKKNACLEPAQAFCKEKRQITPVRAMQYYPQGCKTWFDGCNTCNTPVAGRNQGKPFKCTKNFCKSFSMPMCADYYRKDECIEWFDGCNTCEIFNFDAPTWYCTKRHCNRCENCDNEYKQAYCKNPRLSRPDFPTYVWDGAVTVGQSVVCSVLMATTYALA